MDIKVNDKLVYLGAGCGIGLVLGLLFAPQSGEEIRHTLTSKVDDLTHKVQDKVQEKVQESGIADTASQTWRNVMEKGKNVASIGKTHPIEVEDDVSAILEYPNGAVGHFITPCAAGMKAIQRSESSRNRPR